MKTLKEIYKDALEHQESIGEKRFHEIATLYAIHYHIEKENHDNNRI